MTPAETKNLAESIHDRLLRQARSRGRPLNELLQYYAIERFLYRLGASEYARQFVLKGALMFLAWGGPGLRPTKDIDLLGYTSNATENIIRIVKEICIQPVEPDGMIFNPESIQGEQIKEDADYEGVRIKMVTGLGKARIPIQIDFGFADVISPAPIPIEYPSLLSMPRALLRGYPRETMISEKLQAMIYLGDANSRMKDFYDIWILSQHFEFDCEQLRLAIMETFLNRATQLPAELPTALSNQFAVGKQSQWQGFLKRSQLSDPPADFGKVVKDLAVFLWLPLQMASKGYSCDFEWKGGSWQGGHES